MAKRELIIVNEIEIREAVTPEDIENEEWLDEKLREHYEEVKYQGISVNGSAQKEVKGGISK